MARRGMAGLESPGGESHGATRQAWLGGLWLDEAWSGADCKVETWIGRLGMEWSGPVRRGRAGLG
jgi:hypothetical protein